MRLGRLGWAVLALAPTPALAHSPIPGLKGFYTGMLHPFSTPAQALLVIALGLLIGWFEARRARWTLAAFFIAMLGGGLMGGGPRPLDALLFAGAFAACALAALTPGRLFPLVLAITAISGWVIGIVSVPDPGPDRARIITLSGAFVGANLGLLYLWGTSQFIRERYPQVWIGIAFRIAAAWIGALALIMLALRVVTDGKMP
ncbi:MAG: HupE/UreJ family protein [Paracoccus sp. (in: a-proteobacteria)]